MADVRLEPMTAEQFRTYRAGAEDHYARDIAESGSLTWEDAVEKAAEDYAKLLPDGLATPDQHLWSAYDGDTEVGMLWLQTEARSDGPRAFVLDVMVDPDRRRQGYGRAIMNAAETMCRELGATSIGLNVWAGNPGARALYDELGYQVTSVAMRKRL